jgi:hypothetical protein
MKQGIFLLILIGSLWACGGEKEVTEASQNQTGEWQTIFNGKDLNGWETMGKMETEIRDGQLYLNATHPYNNAWVYTTKAYRNFKLECEFLMPDTTANSGVLVRFDPEKEGIPNATAYEVNIDWRTDIQNTLGTLENAARSNLLQQPDRLEWNKISIEANGDHFKVFINDQKTCETHNSRSLSGRIGLQVPIFQGGQIIFKNIKVMELPETKAVATPLEERYRNDKRPLKPLLADQSLKGWHTIGEGTWNFEEDVLHGYSGEQSSFLVSNKTYKNFYLKTQFKIIKEDNSGIFIRKHPDSTNINLQDAIECNIYDHNGFEHAYSTGSIVTHARAWFNITDYENWNEMEIFAEDQHIILYINGKKSSEAYLPETFNKQGNICLQAGTKVFSDNGPSDIYFKEVIIREMD